MNEKDPKIFKHIDNEGLPDDSWVTAWLFSVFTGFFPTFYCARFIDFILASDIFSMVGLTCAILKNLSNDILLSDIAGICDLLKNLIYKGEEKLWEPDLIIKTALKYNIPREKLLMHLESYWSELDANSKQHFAIYYDHFKHYTITNDTDKDGKHLNMHLFDFKLSVSQVYSKKGSMMNLAIEKDKLNKGNEDDEEQKNFLVYESEHNQQFNTFGGGMNLEDSIENGGDQGGDIDIPDERGGGDHYDDLRKINVSDSFKVNTPLRESAKINNMDPNVL